MSGSAPGPGDPGSPSGDPAGAPLPRGPLIGASGPLWVTGRDGRPVAMLGSTPLLSVSWELFTMGVTLLSVVNIPFYLLPVFSVDVRSVVYTVDIFLTIPLLLDFALRLRRAPDRTAYLVAGRGWLDLVGSLPIPFLRLLRLFRVRRTAQHLGPRGFRGVILTLLREPASGALLGIVLLTIIVIELGSAIILVIEAPAAGASITTPIDALWFSYQTITTVGYGDVTPVTTAGRLVGVVVLTLGIALFATVTGFLADAFVRSRDTRAAAAQAGGEPASPAGDARDGGARPATAADVDALRAELVELRRMVERLADRESGR